MSDEQWWAHEMVRIITASNTALRGALARYYAGIPPVPIHLAHEWAEALSDELAAREFFGIV